MEYNENKATTPVLAERATGTPILEAGAPTKSRIMGVDVARGLALLGMIVVHVSPDFNADGTPTIANVVAEGKAVALFVLLAGVSLAFQTGGRHPVEGQARTAAAASLAVRALLIAFIGLLLGYTATPVDVILVYYGVLFLLAIPLIGLRPGVLACLAIVIALAAPIFMLVIGDSIRSLTLTDDPTFHSLLDPYRLAVVLLLTGNYPALPYMAYICAGLAIGRLNLSSTRVASILLGGGLALAISTWVTSSVLLLHMGGLRQLQAILPAGANSEQLTNNFLLWPQGHTSSWWQLAVRAPYADTPIELLYTIGVSMAVLGAMLLLTRAAAPVLRPLAAAGSMTLTLYSIHVVYMAFDPLSNFPFISFAAQATTALVFAAIWQRVKGRGPFETVVAFAARGTRKAVTALSLHLNAS